MRKGDLIITSWSLLQKISKRKFHHGHDCGGGSSSNRRKPASLSLTEELEIANNIPLDHSSTICIYRVPNTMRRVKIKAYQPNIVSIGPYHRGVESLQEMEKLKRIYLGRLFNPNYPEVVEDQILDDKEKKAAMMELLDEAKKAMQELEEEARSCYSEESELSSEEFVKMMVIDGCFIIGLLMESMHPDFQHTPSTIKRWMLPALRQDLIKLENQLPLFVLRKLFQLIITRRSTDQQADLESLALKFFEPLLKHLAMKKPLREFVTKQFQGKHFLELFHHVICPEDGGKGFSSSTTQPGQDPRGVQTKLIRSIQELKEAGVKFSNSTDINRRPLDISFSRRRGRYTLCWGKVLTIPPIHINDHRGTLFRNLLAFEKCHRNCHQDVTAYLFFLDGLINSGKDVGLLHYHQILYHSLGTNIRVAKLVNNLCKEVCPDLSQSYLYKVVREVDDYYASDYARLRAFLVHHHFSSWLVGISTLGACLALYLTLIQTVCGVASAKKDLGNDFTLGFFLKDAFFIT